MKLCPLLVGSCALLSVACKSKPTAPEVLEAYLSQQSCQARLAFIFNPKGNEKLIADHYKGQSTCVSKHEPIDKTLCLGTDWKICGINTKIDGHPYSYGFVQTSEGPKIDWRCSTGYNPIPLKVFKAQMPKTKSLFRVQASISDYYNYNYSSARRTHYSIEIRDDFESAHAYMPKTAPTAQALFDVLRDGKQHAVIVELTYTDKSEDSGVIDATRFLAEYWYEQPEETAGR